MFVDLAVIGAAPGGTIGFAGALVVCLAWWGCRRRLHPDSTPTHPGAHSQ